jgi:uncharacterized protein YxjI
MTMGLRERRESRHERPAGPVVYRMKAKLVDLGDDYRVETSDGHTAYQVDGKAVRVRDTFTIRDTGGQVVARMKERVAHVRDTMTIDRPGRPSATIRKAKVAPMRQRYVVEADDVGTIDVQGNVVDHEYTFQRDGQPVAEVSRRWMTVRDTFGVQVEPGADAVLVIAATVAIDAMSD